MKKLKKAVEHRQLQDKFDQIFLVNTKHTIFVCQILEELV